MKRRCELCSDLATMYCESDSASLCLRCDETVHGANFLVAKHERSLLCSVCQSVTCWKASGPRLGRTVSVCDVCVCARSGEKIDLKEDDEVSAEEVVVESRDHSAADDDEPDASSDDDADEDEEIEEDDDEENQVVPWSSGEEVSSSCNGGGDRKLMRRRASSDLDSDDEIEDRVRRRRNLIATERQIGQLD
ncbi:unnamed protein product [Rhodiola kirilowii]